MKGPRGIGRVFKRHRVYWIAYYVNGKERRESSESPKKKAAQDLLKKRLGEMGRGELIGPSEERVTVDQLLTDLRTDYEVNGRASLPTLAGHLKALRAAFTGDRALRVSTARIQHVQRAWQEAGVTNATINRRLSMLRRAFNLARRAGTLRAVPYVPRLEENSPPGKHMTHEVLVAIRDHLPRQSQRDCLELAYWYGIRAGQLRGTLLANVDTERWALVYRPEQVKTRHAHVVPLEGRGLEIVRRLWASRRLDCPFLLHGEDCARRPTERPCLVSFKKAWGAACKKAGFPVAERPSKKPA